MSQASFLDRASATGRRLVGRGESVVRRVIGSGAEQLTPSGRLTLEEDVRACVAPSVGEMTARQHALCVRERYAALDEAGREQFFEMLATSFGLDRNLLDQAIARRQTLLESAPVDHGEVLASELAIRDALASPRELLFTRLNGLENGVKFVVDLRADLRDLGSRDPEFRAMDRELKRLLTTWFDVGHLELRRIDWDTSASVLEKLIAYESVHEIESWSDLRNRLDSDRRCYAFFHPGMENEPLIFVEVALVSGLADDLGALLDVEAPILNPKDADTAIFYSISNCQDGLAGVSLGNALIKRVVGALLQELSHLRIFSTLSPLPGFRSWLNAQLEERRDAVFALDELPDLRLALDEHGLGGSIVTTEGTATSPKRTTVAESIPAVLDRHDWPEDDALALALRGPLLRLAGVYLAEAKRGTRALDRVANFHLSNGARVEQLNWLANTGPVGLDRAAGMMVNYRYVPEEIQANHDAYVTNGTIAMSKAVEVSMTEALARPSAS